MTGIECVSEQVCCVHQIATRRRYRCVGADVREDDGGHEFEDVADQKYVVDFASVHLLDTGWPAGAVARKECLVSNYIVTAVSFRRTREWNEQQCEAHHNDKERMEHDKERTVVFFTNRTRERKSCHSSKAGTKRSMVIAMNVKPLRPEGMGVEKFVDDMKAPTLTDVCNMNTPRLHLLEGAQESKNEGVYHDAGCQAIEQRLAHDGDAHVRRDRQCTRCSDVDSVQNKRKGVPEEGSGMCAAKGYHAGQNRYTHNFLLPDIIDVCNSTRMHEEFLSELTACMYFHRFHLGARRLSKDCVFDGRGRL